MQAGEKKIFGTVQEKGENWSQVSDLYGKTFACITTSDYVPVIENNIPDAKILYVQDWADEDLFVAQGKADALILEDSSLDVTMEEYPELCKIPEAVGVLDSRMCTHKDALGNRLVKELNEYVTELKESEEMGKFYDKWKYPDQYIRRKAEKKLYQEFYHGGSMADAPVRIGRDSGVVTPFRDFRDNFRGSHLCDAQEQKLFRHSLCKALCQADSGHSYHAAIDDLILYCFCKERADRILCVRDRVFT